MLELTVCWRIVGEERGEEEILGEGDYVLLFTHTHTSFGRYWGVLREGHFVALFCVSILCPPLSALSFFLKGYYSLFSIALPFRAWEMLNDERFIKE